MPDPRKIINRTPDPVLYAGLVVDTAASDDDAVRVQIPAIADDFTTAPLRWNPGPGGARPHKDDRALVAIDDQGQDWLIAFTGADA
jgi:hypothetical protein